MAVLDALDGAAVRSWCTAGRDALAAARAEIDALNVYPVPDGDTGTNLHLTMVAVVDALDAVDDDLPSVLRAAGRGALMGARGNSGVILSQLLRGFAEGLGDMSTAGAEDVARALCRAADSAYAAVARPVEGTILTVARAAAQAASASDRQLADAVRAAAGAARDALARTPLQLPVLAAAGVVDAGGRGLVVLLDALAAVVTGETAPVARTAVVARDGVTVAARESGSEQYAYEVQFLLDAPDDAVPSLRERLAALGDSVVVVGGDGLHTVHAHVDDIGAAVEAGIDAGRPHRIVVTRFADVDSAADVPRVVTATPAATGTRIVAVAPGAGLAQVLTAAGATVVAAVDARPSTGELLGAIRGTGAATVVVLPNDPDVAATAAAAAESARADGTQVIVLPTRSPVQGLAAVAVHDAGRRFDDDVVAMSAAAAATRDGAVTVASRAALTSAGRCEAGDVLGLVDGDVSVIGDDVVAVAREMLDRMLLAGGELVTLVTGADAPDGLADALSDYLAATRPAVEVASYDGRQLHYPLLVGVE